VSCELVNHQLIQNSAVVTDKNSSGDVNFYAVDTEATRWIGEGLYRVVVHPSSTFSDCCQLSTPLNAEGKNGKNWGFS